jgi:hypothetical protein
LDNFEELARSVIRSAADELDRLQPDFRTQRTTLLQRTRVSQAFHTMLEQEDPIVACLEVWGFSVRFLNYFEEGEGSRLYGEHQHVAVAAARQMEEAIEQIAKMFLQGDVFEETRRQIDSFAGQNPMTGTFSNVVVFATKSEPGQPSPFTSVVSIPMAPFTALKGVDRTAGAIYSVGNSMERISDIVEELPESTRWQLLLLLMEMGETEVIQTVLTSMSTFSGSSAKFAEVAETFPEDLREQLSLLIAEIDAKQARLQTTLDKAEKTAVATEKAISTAGETAETAQQTAETITEMATEWESAAVATEALMESLHQWRREEPESATSSPTTVTDYTNAAQEIAVAAEELQALVADTRGLLESETLAAQVEDVDDRVVAAIDRTAAEANDLTDHITWRLMQLAALVFVLALAYRFTSSLALGKRVQ